MALEAGFPDTLLLAAARWGPLLGNAHNFQARTRQPWLPIACLFVVLTVLLYNFLGDGMRDAADPYS